VPRARSPLGVPPGPRHPAPRPNPTVPDPAPAAPPPAGIPWHSHVSLNSIVSDYVPRGGLRSLARLGVLGSTLGASAGMLMLALNGPGITASVKRLWRENK